jgi:hypothetical protein
MVLGSSFPTPGRYQWKDPGQHRSRCSNKERSCARSQLRGSGGFSPRFPNIPLRDKGGRCTTGDTLPIAKVGEIQVERMPSRMSKSVLTASNRKASGAKRFTESAAACRLSSAIRDRGVPGRHRPTDRCAPCVASAYPPQGRSSPQLRAPSTLPALRCSPSGSAW